MSKHILFGAVSATFGVAAHSSFTIKLLFLILLFFGFLYYRFNGKSLILLLHVLMISLFYMATYFSELRHQTQYTGDETSFLITFNEQPKVDGNLLKAVITNNQHENLQLRYTISTEAEKKQLEKNLLIGLSCLAKGSLVEPEANRNEHSFNYKQYLQQQHIHWMLQVDKMNWAHCQVDGATIVTKIKQIRQQGIAYVNEHFPHEASGFVTALLFGEQSYIEEEVLTTYQRLGIVHLLAISGLHISFLAGMLFFVGIRIGVTRERMMIVILVFLPVHALLSGAAPSVLRACLTAMMFFALLLSKKRVSASATIGVVYLTLLLIQPMMLYNIGFQLSFAVTFAIMMSLSIFQTYMQKTIQLLMVSVVCQLAALPILLYHFYEVSVLGVFLNVLFVPLYSALLLPFSIIAFLLHLIIPPLGEIVITLLDQTFQLCNGITDVVAALPLASISFGKPPNFIMLVLVVLLIGLFVKWEASSLLTAKVWVCLVVCTLLFQYHLQKLNPYGEVVCIDVGQGDAIFIKLPFNQGNYLIDTGGRIEFPIEAWKQKRKMYNTADDVIIPFLKSKGIHHLDKLILTHPDADHIGSAAKLVQHFNAKELVIASRSEDAYQDKESIQWALSKQIPITKVEKGDSWHVGNASFYALHPYQKSEDINESSIVLFAEIGGLTWLFTGDAGESTEQELITAFPNLQVDILKAGHHGSKTSSSTRFLESVDPKVALMSVGKDNRYGHPHQQVLETMATLHISVLRTDIDGAISYKYRKDQGTFQTVLP